MHGYILRRSDLRLKAHAEVPSYTLYPQTSTVGTVTIVDDGKNDYTGDWILLESELWYITQSTVGKETVTLKVVDPIFALDRTLVYTAGAFSTCGAFIAAVVSASYAQEADYAYQLPYLTATADDTITFISPDLGDGNTYTLSEYIQYARREGLSVKMEYTGTGITLTATDSEREPRQVLFSDGHSQLISEQYSTDITAKITVRKSDGNTPPTYTDSTYYLSKSGEISAQMPVYRAEGKWAVITCGADESPLEAAKEVIKDNDLSHKIELYSDTMMELYTPLTLRFENGKIFSTRICKIERKSSDTRVKYTCGNMPTTLTDLLKQRSEI